MFGIGPKLESIQADIRHLLVDQAAIKEDLRHHIKRTDLLETQVRPVTKHVHYVEGAFKLIGVLAVISSIAGAVYGIFFA